MAMRIPDLYIDTSPKPIPNVRGIDSWDSRGARAPSTATSTPKKTTTRTTSTTAPKPVTSAKPITAPTLQVADTSKTVAPTPNVQPEPQYKTVPNMVEVQLPNALMDTMYQKQVSSLAKALSDYQARQATARNQYSDNLANNFRDLGYNANTGDFNTDWGSGAYGTDYNNNMGDFASRGMFDSGIYRQALANMTNRYADQVGDMTQARDQYFNTLDDNLKSQQTETDSAKAAALQQAIARIAAQYGVNSDVIPYKEGQTAKVTQQQGTKRVPV